MESGLAARRKWTVWDGRRVRHLPPEEGEGCNCDEHHDDQSGREPTLATARPTPPSCWIALRTGRHAGTPRSRGMEDDSIPLKIEATDAKFDTYMNLRASVEPTGMPLGQPTAPHRGSVTGFNRVRSPLRRRVDVSRVEIADRRSMRSESQTHRDDVLAVAVCIGISILIASAVTLPLMPRPRSAQWTPEPAPEFTLPTDRNDTVSLSHLRGQVVVIHFVILVCCAYSALEVGYMMEVEPSAREQAVVFVSIVVNSEYNYFSPEKYRELMGFNWTLALDLSGRVQGLYEADETSTFVIDRDGVIQYRDDVTTSASTLAVEIQKVI